MTLKVGGTTVTKERSVSSFKVVVSEDPIREMIFLVRGQKVILDRDLAALYQVTTSALNQAVRRNQERFPEDFCFALSKEETSLVMDSRSQTVILKRGQNAKYSPLVFTEQGVAMLSSVLRSERAVQVNISIVRVFVKLRQMLASNAELARKLAELENKYDHKFKIVFDAIRALMAPETLAVTKPKREIGFHAIPSRLTETKKNSKLLHT